MGSLHGRDQAHDLHNGSPGFADQVAADWQMLARGNWQAQQAAAKLDALLNAAASASVQNASARAFHDVQMSDAHVHDVKGFVRLHSSCLLIPQSHTITQQLQLKGADQPLPVSQHLSIQHMQPAVIDSSASSEADQTLHHQDRKSARSDPEQSMELVADPPQHPSQGVNSSNDQDASTAPVQLNDAPRAPLLSKYPHLEKALRSAAEQAAYAPQRVTLFNEFAAEELRTLSRLLPAGGLASGVDGNNQQQVSSPQDGKGAYHQDSPQEETAGEPSLAEAQVNTQMHRGWGGEQEAASEEAAQMAQPADSSPQASKKRKHQAIAAETANDDDDDDAKNGSSKFRGVYKRRFDTKWRAEITAGRRKRCLGSFSNELDAAKAYDKAALTLRGPAAFTNFPADHYASISTRNEPVNVRCGSALKDRRFMGVTWCDDKQQFEARIWTKDGEEHKLLGLFDSAEDAAHFYDQAALKMHGQEAYTNFVLTPGVTLCHGVPPKPQRQGSGQALGAGLTVSVKPSALDQLPTGKGSSKFRGVSWHKDNMKWRATIFKGSKPVHIGYFEGQQEAARAYDQEAIRLRGPNTLLNYPITDYDVGPPDPNADASVPSSHSQRHLAAAHSLHQQKQQDQQQQHQDQQQQQQDHQQQHQRQQQQQDQQQQQAQQQDQQQHDALLPHLDSRLVAVFGHRSPRKSAVAPSPDQTTTDGMMHEDTPSAGWHTAHGRQQQQQQRHPPLAAATSLQSLLQTNPGILKTIQPNDASGGFSSRGRPLGKSARHMQEGVLAGTTSFSSAPQARPAQSDDHDEDLRSTDATAQGSLMQGTSGSRRRQASQRHTLAFDDDRRHVSSRSVSPYDTDQDTSSGERSPVRTKTRTIRKPQHRS